MVAGLMQSGLLARITHATCQRPVLRPNPSHAQRCRPRSRGVRAEAEVAAEIPEADRIAAVRIETTRRISALGRQGRPRDATLQLAEMARLGVQPDAMAATALIDACARNGKLDMAMNVFDELFGALLEPDDITFSTLVRGYGEAEPPQWAGISTVLGVMQQRFGMRPGTAVFASMLGICVRTRDDQRGYDIIDRMARSGVVPDDQVLEAVRPRKSLRSHLRRVYNSAAVAGLPADSEVASEVADEDLS